jgi:hypothetical protein
LLAAAEAVVLEVLEAVADQLPPVQKVAEPVHLDPQYNLR